MADWVLRCKGCKARFKHSKIDDDGKRFAQRSSANTTRLIDTDPLGAHLDYFGFADNTGIGGLTGRSIEANSGWPTKRALNDLMLLERKI